ncbi:NTP/NDP exchange transporter [Sandaracinus amylolyticus]|uniref:ADP,ATP carrier protein n=1 Tax=Sandaracinus amylolyticus TaxID=927083 RepID=A0A0F6W7Y6_9BACT|nr:Npt1/Npt2 family nucleotide transporter [Sandaracinus amylolyticus]AKF09602.1 transporter [Sandaracinus amylolyticus]
MRPGEWPLAIPMFAQFFLVIATFWVLKPIKKGIFVAFYDEHGLDLGGWHLEAAQAELLAKVANMVVAALAVVVFSALSRTLRREKLTFVFAGFFVVALAVFALVIGDPGHFVVWSFYLLGDLYTTLMVATFFAFLNDSVSPDDAKRLYPPIVLGGVAGGAFGSSVLSAWIDSIDHATWIWICVGTTVTAALLAGLAGRVVARREPEPAREPEAREPEAGNPVIAGARLVARSPYLLAIAAIVGLYEIVSTLLDFQFTSTVAHFLDDEAIGEQFALVFTITNVAALFVQIFVTTFVMSRFPLVVSLMTTPLVILGASMGYLIVPILWTGSLLNTADNAFSYSINQSAKEALYTPTSRDEKYKAKAFLDMFVQRFAKSIAVGVSLLVTTVFTDFSTIRWLSIAVVALVAVWLFAARYAGMRFREMTHDR